MYGLYISIICLSGTLPQVWARDQLTWVRSQGHISCCTWRINEQNCKTNDREERLRRRREYERARHSAEKAKQKEIRLSRCREADRDRHVAT